MRLYDAYNFDSRRANNSDIANGPSNSDGVFCSAIRDHPSLVGIPSVVNNVLFSIFKMGKLSQSQKALFLWKSPLAKLQ